MACSTAASHNPKRKLFFSSRCRFTFGCSGAMASPTEDILAKCQHLVACGLWPSEQDLRFRAWLTNFRSAQDKQAAIKILDRFVYINEDMAYRAFICAYQCFLRQMASEQSPLTQNIGSRKEILRPTIAKLEQIHNNVYVTGIRGEELNPADSCFAYLRAARDKLGFREDQIIDLDKAVVQSHQDSLVILVDDTIGTGSQLEETLSYSNHSKSLAQASRLRGNVVCIVAMATSKARQRLYANHQNLRMFAGHILDVHEYSVNCLLPYPEHPDVHELLARTARRLSVPSHVNAAYGYKKLGLMLAFHNSIPDFSLPILWASGDEDWKALKLRHGD